MPRPSPALVISIIALVFAMGGTGYAVTQLPKNSVGTKQLKKDAVTGAKIKTGAVSLGDISKSAQATLKGATGATGPAGPTASAYVYVDEQFTPNTTPALDQSGGAQIAQTTIAPTYAARLAITAQVMVGTDIATTTNDAYLTQCWITVDGTRTGAVVNTTTYIHGASDQFSANGASMIAGADVGAGSHAIALRCQETRDAGWIRLYWPSIVEVANAR